MLEDTKEMTRRKIDIFILKDPNEASKDEKYLPHKIILGGISSGLDTAEETVNLKTAIETIQN